MQLKNIRFIHVADLHLGKAFPYTEEGLASKGIEDRFATFDTIIEICKEKKIDYLFLVGDIFEQDLFKRSHGLYFMKKLSELENCQVLYVMGNHDYKLEDYLRSISSQNLFIFSSKKMDLWRDSKRNLEVYGQSWNHLSHTMSPILPFLGSKGPRRILLHHGMWTGTDYFSLNLSKKDQEFFDYIGLGHIHKPSSINSKTQMVGTPEVLSHKDLGQRGIIQGDLGQSLDLSFLAISRRSIHKIELELDSSIEFQDLVGLVKEKIINKGDIYYLYFKGFPLNQEEKEALNYFLRQEDVYVLMEDHSSKSESLTDIYKKHEDDIIGDFIRRVDSLEIDNSLKGRVAQVGLEALLHGGKK